MSKPFAHALYYACCKRPLLRFDGLDADRTVAYNTGQGFVLQRDVPLIPATDLTRALDVLRELVRVLTESPDEPVSYALDAASALLAEVDL